MQEKETQLMGLAKEMSEVAVVKDVFVHAAVNEEGMNLDTDNEPIHNAQHVDELEMKLEWINVEMRSMKMMTGELIEQIEKGTQTQFPKHRKDLLSMKTISPTPKSPIQK